MSDQSFVRTELLPELPPPAAESGVIGWLRKNLFSSPVSSIATIVTAVLLFSMAFSLLSWAVVPTWQAASLSECRGILEELGRDGHYAGACWGVVRDRAFQLAFGFYPAELVWRPILAFVLLGVALAPILFGEHVPRKLFWFSALYPFLMPWLLWGNTIWVPLGALAGFVIGYLSHRFTTMIGEPLRTIIALLAALIWWLVIAGPLAAGLSDILPLGIEAVKSRAFGGFMLSVTIGVVSIAFSLPIGILLALGRQSDLLIIKSLCVGFIEFIRGVPLITLLFVASTLLNIFMPPGTDFDIVLRVIIMATLFSSAYIAEVIRGGLAALPKGQYEGADSLGLNYWQATRLIVMPQALKISIPGIVSTFIALFKDTTLVSVIGLLDPLGLTDAIRANQEWNGIVWELYGFIALMFMMVCFSMSRYSMYLEHKLHTGYR